MRWEHRTELSTEVSRESWNCTFLSWLRHYVCMWQPTFVKNVKSAYNYFYQLPFFSILLKHNHFYAAKCVDIKKVQSTLHVSRILHSLISFFSPLPWEIHSFAFSLPFLLLSSYNELLSSHKEVCIFFIFFFFFKALQALEFALCNNKYSLNCDIFFSYCLMLFEEEKK